jgi:glycerol-3-phosphate O-acyltransferase/dihydroxyacetone phosphate acyltransferase
MTPAIWLYFRRSFFLDAEKIPSKGPVIIISNHAASFLDAMIMGVKLRRPMHYYVRSDIFKSRLARFIFGKLHMIPIYSREKDKGELHRNADSFNIGEEVLRKGGVLLIFPEGTSRTERNLLPLKKGVSRIALQALEKGFEQPLVIVPIGIHYSRHAFRSDLQLTTGDPVPIGHYREVYLNNPAKAVNLLTEELEVHFEKVVLYIDQPQRTALLENCLGMADNERENYFRAADFQQQKRICAMVSSLDEDEFRLMEHKQSAYISALAVYGVHDKSFTEKGLSAIPPLLLVLCFPLFAAGIMLNVWPYLAGRKVADKKVTRIDFYTSVLVAVSAIVYMLWMLVWLAIAVMIKSAWMAIIFLSAPLLAWVALWWAERYRNWTYRQQYEKLQREEPSRVIALKAMRQELIQL